MLDWARWCRRALAAAGVAALAMAVLPVKARSFGKIERRVRIWDKGALRAYAPGTSVSPGSPGFTTPLRPWRAIFGVFPS